MAIARAMYAGGPSDNELAQVGLLREDVQVDVEVWTENWPSLELFSALSTQWRVGMNGPTGLDYSAVPVVMDMRGIEPDARRDIFEDIRIMERAAIEVFRDQ
jgi:hypothetical protein